MLTASGLGKRFGSRWLFRRVELDVASGEVLLVTGPNGSGKSTLLRILAGLEPSTEGTVRSDSAGFIAPDVSLYPHLTGTEHLQLVASFAETAQVSPRDLLERVGLASAANQRTQEYSTGMRTRLKLAIAILRNPKVLLLDEPSVGLDTEGKRILEEIIKNHLASGCVVLSTNDPSDRRFGDLELQVGA